MVLLLLERDKIGRDLVRALPVGTVADPGIDSQSRARDRRGEALSYVITPPRSSAQSRDGNFRLSLTICSKNASGSGANAVLTWKSRANSRETGSEMKPRPCRYSYIRKPHSREAEG
jgi:hypothetical protein